MVLYCPSQSLFSKIVVVQEKGQVVLEWDGSNLNDMYADAVLTLCLQIEANPQAIKQSSLRSITQVSLGIRDSEGPLVC